MGFNEEKWKHIHIQEPWGFQGAEPTNMVVSWDLTKWAQLQSDVSGKCWKTMQAWRIDQDL